MRFVISTIAGLCLACGQLAADLPIMGAEWFDRLLDPTSRVEALWEWEQKGEYPQSRERFLAGEPIWVFKCPQPDHPEAWLVLRGGDYHRVSENQFGKEPDVYPPHPEELKRREDWFREMARREKMGEVWKPGEPWLDSVTGFLVDRSGRVLADEFWIGAGVIGDFTGDGFLDVFEVSRFSSSGRSQVLDGLAVGPLDHSKERDRTWYCNFGDSTFRSKRDWKFRLVSEAPGTLAIRFCPVGGGEEVKFSEELSKDKTRPIYSVKNPTGTFYHATSDFLETIGEANGGVGTDDVRDLDATLDVPEVEEFKNPFLIPDLSGLTPREAALKLARANQDAVHQSQFDFRSSGEPIKNPKSGWLELMNDGGGWHPDSTAIWWLRGDRAECWSFDEKKGGLLMNRALVDPARVAWMMAVVGEIDLLRSVPRHPLVRREMKWGSSFDDLAMEKVRMKTEGNKVVKVAFDYELPFTWSRMDGRWDRSLAGVFSSMMVSTLLKEDVAEKVEIRKVGHEWLEGHKFREVPPALLRRLVKLAGEGKWREYRPRLIEIAYLLEVDAPSVKITARLDEIAKEIPPYDAKEDRKKFRFDLLREQSELEGKLVGNPRFELLEVVNNSLEQLE